MSPQDDKDDWDGKGQSNEMIIYQDFPRHGMFLMKDYLWINCQKESYQFFWTACSIDGTPCVMYTAKDEIDWNYTPKVTTYFIFTAEFLLTKS